MNEIKKDIHDTITISVSEYLTHELVEKLAFLHWRSKTTKDFNHIRSFIYDSHHDSYCFNVIALNSNGDVIGRLFCLKNQKNPKRWYHGDLVVEAEYRRRKIASRLLQTAIQKISDMGGEILHGFTDKANTASINLHKSLGFAEKPCVQFDNLIHGEEQIMLERRIEKEYNVIPATVDEAQFIWRFYCQNRDALHGKHITPAEWTEIMSKNDPDEQNFLVCKGAIPVAWFRINGLEDTDTAWISMLAVSDKWQRQGIGAYAIGFAENYVKSKGFNKLGIRTTEDNIAAQSLYKRCGYTITEHGDCTTGDGVARKGYTFVKDLK